MADGFTEFLFGSSRGTDTRQDVYDQIQNNLLNQNNFMQNFQTNAGTALNSLANRGVINSSVTGKAMSDALNQAQQNYTNTQLQAYGLLSNYLPQDTQGLITGMLGGVSGGFGTGLGKGLGTWIGNKINQ